MSVSSLTNSQKKELDKFLKGFTSGPEEEYPGDDAFPKFSVPEKEIAKNAEDYKPVETETQKDHKERKKAIPNLKELTFVRLLDPIHIPSYLVEQIKDKLYTVERFYQYQKMACLHQTPTGPNLNEANLLYAITHEKLRQVKGFAWMEIEPLTNNLIVKSFSMDREYWNKADAISLLEEKAKKIMKDLSLSRIVWVTKNPRFCENKGFKRSKDAIMIFEG